MQIKRGKILIAFCFIAFYFDEIGQIEMVLDLEIASGKILKARVDGWSK